MLNICNVYNLQSSVMSLTLLYTDKSPTCMVGNTCRYILLLHLIYEYGIIQREEFTFLSLHDIKSEIGLNHVIILLSTMLGPVMSFTDF